MPPIRVVFATLPPLLEKYFSKVIGERNDMELVDSYGTCEQMIAQIQSAEPDIALVFLDKSGSSSDCLKSVYETAQLKVIAIDETARHAFLVLGEASDEKVIDSIRMVARKYLH